MCVDQNEIALSDSHCNVETRPIDVESCGLYLPICDADTKNNDDNNDDGDDDENDNSNMIV